MMNAQLRKLRGVLSISLLWGPLWAAMFTVLTSILALFLPFDGDVGTFRMMAIIGWVGVVSGGLFGILLSIAERGKAVGNLSLRRVALWGLLAAAVFPLVTGRADQVFWTCPFGAIVAVALVAIARQAARLEARQQRNFFFACALAPVRDVVNPAQEPSL